MTLINDIANIVSMIGTCCGLFSRVPQVYRTYTTKSAALDTKTSTYNTKNSDLTAFAGRKFRKAGKDISYSRNVARAHYKSDSKFGEEISPASSRVQKFLERLLELNLIILK